MTDNVSDFCVETKILIKIEELDIGTLVFVSPTHLKVTSTTTNAITDWFWSFDYSLWCMLIQQNL